MKNLKKSLKQVAVYTVISSLLHASFSVVYASAETAAGVMNVATQGMQMYGQFMNMNNQQKLAQAEQAKIDKTIAALSPNACISAGNCNVTPSKIFPQCQIANSVTNLPVNMCQDTSLAENPMTLPTAKANMLKFQSLANTWMNEYDKMNNPAGNSPFTIGVQCLSDNQKKLDSELIEMMNNLTRLSDQLNKEKELFKANNKKIIDQMNLLSDELNGSKTKNDLKAKTTDYTKLFSSSCQNILGNQLAKLQASGGFVGVSASMDSTKKLATDQNNNKIVIEKEIRRDVERIAKQIKDGGLSDFLNAPNLNNTQYKSIAGAFTEQGQEFTIAFKRISGELSKIGYNVETMDKNFSVDFADFLTTSKSFFKKKYIDECVTGTDKTNIAISSEQILSSLRQRSTGSSGTATEKYKVALQNILNSDAYIQDKVNQIKALEATYKDISISYQGSNGQVVTSSPYDLYIKTINSCEQAYAQSNVNNSGSISDVSQKKKVDRGQALLRELQGLHDNYASNFVNRALDKALNCSGDTKKAGSSGTSCSDAGTYNHKSENYCLSHANQCSNEVTGCAAELTNQIETRKTKMQGLAATYNANMTSMVTRANALLKQQNTAITNLVKGLQAKIPGTNFQIPADLFLALPEMNSAQFGVDMINNGNMAFLDHLTDKIEGLKVIFKDQQNKTNNEISQYIADQSTALSNQKSRWKSVYDECTGAIKQISSQIAAYNREGAINQNKQDAAVGNYCRKYSALKENPMGMCDTAKDLYENMGEVAARVTNTAQYGVGKLAALCNQYNNDSKEEDSTLVRCNTDKEFSANAGKSACMIAWAKAGITPESSSKSMGITAGLEDVCGDNAKDASDETLVANLISKYAADSKDKYSSAKTLSELSTVARKNGNAKIFNFLKNATRAGDKSSSDSLCKQLASLPEVDETKSELQALVKKEKEAIEKDFNSRKPADSGETNKWQIELDKKKGEIDSKYANHENAILLNTALSFLEEEAKSELEIKTQQFANLGEQLTQDCDAQASNRSMPKGFGSVIEALDASILGSSR